MAANTRREFVERIAVCSGVAGFWPQMAGAEGQSAGPADRLPGLPPAIDAQRLSCVRQEDGRDRRYQAGALFADRLRGDFASLANGKEVRKILADHGMKAESSHFSMHELRKSQEKSIAWANDAGIMQMITATLGRNGGNNPTLDQVKKAADEYNKIAAVAGEGRHAAGPAQRGLRGLNGRRQADVRPAARPA